ncbi:Hypothetical_protein [Hexamita inflata]|uniref:Hypothetical_protein n=1 Tax=Hexamita inflata TaxID=28002 RepID=A0AA86NWB6_9EUKA|nr:Hypothetical protein HINF_LOCUS14689 [Hexamita inflata]
MWQSGDEINLQDHVRSQVQDLNICVSRNRINFFQIICAQIYIFQVNQELQIYHLQTVAMEVKMREIHMHVYSQRGAQVTVYYYERICVHWDLVNLSQYRVLSFKAGGFSDITIRKCCLNCDCAHFFVLIFSWLH